MPTDYAGMKCPHPRNGQGRWAYKHATTLFFRLMVIGGTGAKRVHFQRGGAGMDEGREGGSEDAS